MNQTRIVLTGGGSGGHITPIQAIAAELRSNHPEIELIYIGQTSDKLGDIPAADKSIDTVYKVRAGKLRRYHGEGIKQLFDFPTIAKNLRDIVYVIIGIIQSYVLLRKIRPSIIFIKGGFVGVPVGLAAAALKIPYITHDSDSIPGLANRIIAKWAVFHAVALPKELYPYPSDRTVTTGIPLQTAFVPVTSELKSKYRDQIKIPINSKVVLIIGGGLGAQRINSVISDIVPRLLFEFPDLYVIHGVGRANEVTMNQRYNDKLSAEQHSRLITFGYISDIYKYSGAADMVVTRAGATNLAEFALQGKACIVIPSPFLTGGHQLKNAKFLSESGSAIVLDEAELAKDSNLLANQIRTLFSQPESISALETNMSRLAMPNATKDLADLIFRSIR